MTCEEIRDLIPAYSLGTATREEISTVEQHLEQCDLHADAAAMGATAALLSSSAAQITPPSELKNRIMAHARKTSSADTAGRSGRTSRLYRRLLVANPLAAVLVVAIGIMAVWNIMLQGADDPERFTHYYWGNDNDWMRIETVLGEPGAEVSLGGVDRLDDLHRYHLWTTRGDDVLLVGSFNVSPEGRWGGEFEFAFEEGDRVWMTTEPASGSDQPTGDPVLRTRF